MAVFTDPAKFAKHIGEYGKRIADVEPAATRAAALAATTAIRGEAKGFHIRRRKLGVGFEMTGRSSALIQARGPWGIVEKGSRPHLIPKSKGRRRKRVVTPYGVFPQVHHPGHGSLGHPWEIGVAKARKVAPEAFNKAVVKTVFH